MIPECNKAGTQLAANPKLSASTAQVKLAIYIDL